jgi:predicted RecA/RadA family phage recombinase
VKRRGALLPVVGLLLLALAIAATGGLMVVLPQRSQASSLDAKIAATQLQLASVASRHGQGPNVHASDLFLLARAMPDQADMAGVVLELAQLAKAASTTLVSIAPATAPTTPRPDGSTEIPLTVVVDGNWHGVQALLHRLRTHVQLRRGGVVVAGRLFSVSSVQINAGDHSEVEASLGVSAFTHGVKPPPTATSTTPTTTSPGTTQASGATGAGS